MSIFVLNVGAEKAATTWLYSYFLSRADFTFIGKELNIIKRDSLVPDWSNVREYQQDISKYFEYVNTIPGNTGEFTHYEGSTANIFNLYKNSIKKDIIPIYIMRDPLSRAWSSYNMLGAGELPKNGASKFLLQNYLSCKYKETIEALDLVFDNTIYLFYEELLSSIEYLCEKLNIEYIPANITPVNVGQYRNNKPSREFIEEFVYTDKNKNAIDFIVKKFGRIPWNISQYQ